MTAAEWLVLIAGIAAVLWVNWYFFAPHGAAFTPSSDTPDDEIVIEVSGGYDPSLIRVRAGRKVRLTFDRQEESGCSEEIVIPDFGIRKFLPAFRRTTIEITPPAPGRYPFTCGMSMLHGTIVAE